MLNQYYWSDLDSLIKCYYIGFLIGDGCVYNNKLSIGLSAKDIDWLQTFKNETTCTANIRLYSNNGYDCVSLEQSSRQWCDDLYTYNVIPRKSCIVELPMDEVNTLEEISALILGIFDSDGTIGLYPRKNSIGKFHYQFSIAGSKALCLQIREQLTNNLDIFNGTLYNKKNNLYQISWAGKQDIIKICEFLYQNTELSDIWLKRKYNKFKEIRNDR
jgi:hypothetical protein